MECAPSFARPDEATRVKPEGLAAAHEIPVPLFFDYGSSCQNPQVLFVRGTNDCGLVWQVNVQDPILSLCQKREKSRKPVVEEYLEFCIRSLVNYERGTVSYLAFALRCQTLIGYGHISCFQELVGRR